MITDTLAQCHRYAALSPRFAAAFKYLEQLPADHAPGRYELDGHGCFALVQSYATKPLAAAKFEAHQQYIDIQFIQSGRESILWSPLAGLTEMLQPYVAEKDIAFYAVPSHVTPINLRAGEFAIFFPSDGHAPGLEYDGAADVRKTVIKVQV
jgi:biofilm protein TabA